MSFSRQILVGLAAGVGLGLFLGELAAPFQVLADAYVRLLQMTVLPYMIVSLIAGLGSLSADQAKAMLTRVGAVIALLWAVGIGFAFLMPLSFPSRDTASFFSTSQLHTPEPFDFLGLYIPHEPVPCPGQQRGAGHRLVLHRRRRGPHRREGQGAHPRTNAGARPHHRRGQPLRREAHAHRSVRHRGEPGRHAAPGGDRANPGLPDRLWRDRRPSHAVGPARARACLDPRRVPGGGGSGPRRAAHRLHDRQPLRGAPDAGRVRSRHPEAPRRGNARGRGVPRRHRPRFFQLPAFRKAALPELHPLRCMVLGDRHRGAWSSISSWPSWGS